MIDAASDDWYWYHYDGLGSVVALSNTSGAIVERYAYSVFGETTVYDAGWNSLTPNKSAYGNPYMFTGRRFDPDTTLYYYRARYYSSEDN